MLFSDATRSDITEDEINTKTLKNVELDHCGMI